MTAEWSWPLCGGGRAWRLPLPTRGMGQAALGCVADGHFVESQRALPADPGCMGDRPGPSVEGGAEGSARAQPVLRSPHCVGRRDQGVLLPGVSRLDRCFHPGTRSPFSLDPQLTPDPEAEASCGPRFSLPEACLSSRGRPHGGQPQSQRPEPGAPGPGVGYGPQGGHCKGLGQAAPRLTPPP